MPPAVATCGYVLLIMGLFWLDRNPRGRTSAALWIPVIWVSIACSRSVSTWLNISAAEQSTDQVLEGNPVDRLVYSVLLAAGILVVFNRRQQTARFVRANVPIVLFFLYCLLSLLWS